MPRFGSFDTEDKSKFENWQSGERAVRLVGSVRVGLGLRLGVRLVGSVRVLSMFGFEFEVKCEDSGSSHLELSMPFGWDRVNSRVRLRVRVKVWVPIVIIVVSTTLEWSGDEAEGQAD